MDIYLIIQKCYKSHFYYLHLYVQVLGTTEINCQERLITAESKTLFKKIKHVLVFVFIFQACI